MQFIPATIRTILTATVMMAAAIAAFWAQRDWQSALVFGGSVAWAIANLVIWSAFAHVLLRQQIGDKGLFFVCVGLAKIVLFGGGLAALIWAAPLSRVELAAVLSGVSLTLLVSLLIAVGARLLGREMSDGEPEPQRGAAAPAPESGGKF